MIGSSLPSESADYTAVGCLVVEPAEPVDLLQPPDHALLLHPGSQQPVPQPFSTRLTFCQKSSIQIHF